MQNQVFGQLTFIEEVESHIKGHRLYRCLCSCGREHFALRNNLLKGNTTRCKTCAYLVRSKHHIKHDFKYNKNTYVSYRCMLYRCENSLNYLRVEICKEWLDPDDGFKNFVLDMGDRPDGCTLDRIDNNKGYSKDNCRWAPYGVQNHNKSKSIGKSKYKGVTNSRGIWIVQFYYKGKSFTFRSNSETDAATQYDNFSEDYYGDRPNGTIRRNLVSNKRKLGGVSFDKKSNKFRVRLTIDGKRKTVGYFDTEKEAIEKLLDLTSN